jgi:NitT/TauT family transport system ATP-binding protein
MTSLNPVYTVGDQIAETYVTHQGMDKAEAFRRSAEMLRLVGIPAPERRVHEYPHQLSGGMRQRVNLARALAVDPDVLLMDEPFAALDAQTRELMQAELLRIWSEERKNVVFITHQIEEAVYLADRVLVFSARPSTVKASFVIDLPRPRPLAVKRQPALLGHVDAIWRLIEEEVKV